mmetsp:Transcript_19917/g.33572  ORF Transcript_19917/g.33572 Transcript_19917/m.33572 type:complete len:1191 (+) Transcript_19917:54-3626(+)
MEDNWRSAARKVEGHQRQQADNTYNSKHPHAKRDTRRNTPISETHKFSGEAGSGFAKNYKVTRMKNSRGEKFDGKNSQSRGNEAPHCSEDIVVGVVYEGVVNAIKLGREGGLYCNFGVSDTASYSSKGFVSRIFYNNQEKRPFQKGDRVQVQCLSTSPSVVLCLTPEYVRPLIILDINGPLGERAPYNPGEPSKKRVFNKRNYLQDFLRFVSERFEVAVWSCSTRKNLELNIFSGISLVFVWCQEESTSLYPRTSFISPAKPLFLKEIQKVWTKYPSFNASNTVLLDNHLEKFERNPFGTGIIVPDQEPEVDDAVLAPESELCCHLLEMVSQSPLDFSTYVSQLGGSSSLFPGEYPVPPTVEEIITKIDDSKLDPVDSSEEVTQSQEDVTQDSLAPVLTQNQPQQYLPDTPMPSSDVLAWQYIYAVCNNNSKVANIHVKKRSLPGPKTTAMHRKDIVDVASPDYVVCEKTDGERIILVINPEHGVVYFVRRNLSVEVLTLGNSSNQEVLSHWVRGLNGLTVLDGELIAEATIGEKKQKPRQAFLCFDAIIVNDDFVGKRHGVSLLERVAQAEAFLSKSPLYFFAFSPSPLLFKCKSFTSVANIVEVVALFCPLYATAMPDDGEETPELLGWVYGEESTAESPGSVNTPAGSGAFPHMSDGLVFTPMHKNYYDYIAYKWKPASMCTVDFAISLGEVSNALQRQAEKFSVTGSVLSHNDSHIPLIQVWMTKRQGSDVMESKTVKSFMVVECAFEGKHSQWVLKRIRLDRASPNSLKSAWGNLEVIAEAVTLDCIVDTVGKREEKKSVDAVTTPVDDVGKVSMHYDMVQASRQTGFREERIAVHRKVMNWSKACLFKAAMFFTSSMTEHPNDNYLIASLQKQHAEYFSGKKCFPNLNSAEKKPKKSNHKSSGAGAINVLDIACGRGGDIRKFTSDHSVNVYVGVDISPEQLKDCEERAKQNRGIKHCITCLGDASTGSWKDLVSRFTNMPSSSGQFDAAWCMFALHYFCGSEDTLRLLFLHVADSLKVGGKFACTFPNPYYIHDQLTRGAAMRNEDSVDDKIYKVCSNESGDKPFALSIEDCLTTFGNVYQFSLGDAVQDCEEYIVPFEKVLEIATEVGLRVSSFKCNGRDSGTPMALSMNTWISQCCLTSEGLVGLRRVMGVTGDKSAGRDMSTEEWEAISLYMCAVWTKIE